MISLSKKPTIKEVHSLYLKKEARVSDVVKYFLERSKDVDKEILGVVRYTQEYALEISAKLDSELENSKDVESLILDKPLFGVPFMIKDNILVEGHEVTSQSRILECFKAPYSADIYNNLKSAGAVLIAQTNMDEFAFGSSTEFSGFGQVTKNPYDKSRVAGGTSGGSAACVASGQAVFAIGTDTGGSIRQPSSFCGVVGIRPTYGAVSRYGIMASTSSFDQAGPITNTLEDNEKVLSVLRKETKFDQTCLNYSHKADSTATETSVSKGKIKIGIVKQMFADGVDSKVKDLFDEMFSKIENEFELVEVDLKSTKYNISAYYILQTVEAAANLERFDGVRYGKQGEGEMFYSARGGFFGEETKRRIMLGTYTSSAGYYDAYYNQACRVREKIRREFVDVLSEVDVLITPVSPFPAFKIGENIGDPMAMYLADIMTVSQPIAKLPGMSLPIGEVEYEEAVLPVGAQIISKELGENEIYKVANLIQKSL